MSKLSTILSLLVICGVLVAQDPKPLPAPPSRGKATQDAARAAADGIPPCPTTPEPPSPGNMIRPKYPPDALRKGVAASVELRAKVRVEGKTMDIAVLDGDPEFSKSAVEAILKWRFRPVSSHGHLVEATYNIHVRFNPVLREANSDVEIESPQPDPLPASFFAKAHLENLGVDVHKTSEAGVVAPKQLYAPEPEFSEKARKANEQGTVTIFLIVGTDGLPSNAITVCGPTPDLSENAIEAVRHWKFAPGTKDGKPVVVEIAVEVQFSLENDH